MIRTPFRLRLAAVLLALTSAPASATMPPYQGPMPPELSRAFAQGGFAIQPARPARSGAAPAGLEPPSTHNLWRVPVVLVSYADSSCKFTPANFNATLFDTTGTSPTGSIYDYYQWASHGRIRVIPTIVGVVKVPNTRTYYGGNFWGLDRSSTAQSDYGLVRDALSRTSSSIDWSVFDQDHDYRVDVVWVVHAGIGGELSRDTTRSDLWSINSQLTNYWLGGIAWDTPTPIPGGGSLRYQVDHFNILPELSGFDPSRISEIGVFCHEFGHALGLPDLYDTQSNGYPNAGPARWSLMAAGVYGGDGHSPQYPVRPGAWCEQYLGWTPLTRPTRDTTMVMAPIAQNGPILDLCFQGQPSADHFLVENRHRESFDRNLPNDGLLVWHADEGAIALRLPANLVNSGLTPGLVIVEGDGDKDMQRGGNLGDSSDVFPGAPPLLRTYLYDVGPEPSTRTFTGGISNLGLFDIHAVGGSGAISTDVQVRAPGWQAEVDRTILPYDPTSTTGTGNRSVVDASGNLRLIGSELVSGHTQILLRERLNDVWQPAIPVSQTTGQASDGAVAGLTGGDVAVVWTDTRDGGTQIYYRARVGGAWMPETRLAALPGENYGPAISANARGLVEVAWLNVSGGVSNIRLMAFAYASPFGRVYTATSFGDRPNVPAVAVDSKGGSVVAWTDNGLTPSRVRFAHFSPDSGMGPALTLAEPTGNLPQSVQAMFDAAGTLHTVWVVSGPGASEVRYQRRPRDADPFPPDSAIASIGGVIQNARMTLDPTGGVHVVYQGTHTTVSQLFYKRWLTDRGWDTWATELTPFADGSAFDPLVTSAAPGRVTVLYTRHVSGQARLFERRRVLDTPVQLGVPPLPPVVVGMARAWPNPLHSGQALTFSIQSGDMPEAATLEVLDIAGRRVAAAPLGGPASSRAARFDAPTTAGWAPGIYFLRLSGHSGSRLRVVVLR